MGIGLAVVLGGCGETVQTIDSGRVRKADTPPWTAHDSPYRARGWNAGNQAAFDAQLRARAQGQNDYAAR
nr:hypothetical protein [Schlegelella koreensis]